MQDKILEFQNENRWLSNFWPAEVWLDGDIYSTVEAAYQAAKTLSQDERSRIRLAKKPGDAKRFGRLVTIRADWEGVKLSVMGMLLRQKFNNQTLKELLLATGNADLIEGNRWGDKFWGVHNGVGENHLGKLLMKIRSELNG